MKIKKSILRKLILLEISKTMNESELPIYDKGQVTSALDILLPIVEELMENNADKNEYNEYKKNKLSIKSNFQNSDNDLKKIIEDNFDDVSKNFLASFCSEQLTEVMDKLSNGEDINPDDFEGEISDIFFENIEIINNMFKKSIESLNAELEYLIDKKNKEEEEKKKIYSGDFPIACSSWMFLTDSSGLPLPEESAFIIKKKGSKNGICYSGSDFPLMIDGVEIYDISNKFYQEKGESPLICSYKGKDNILVPAIK